MNVFERTVNFVKEMARGPCNCRYDCGSASTGYYDDLIDAWVPGKFDRGPRTLHCQRCQAREALNADGIEFATDDHVRRSFTTL